MIKAAGAVPILYETSAYRAHVKESEKLGSWEDFTIKQTIGYKKYAEVLGDLGAKVSPVNQAFALVK
jgi:hypothetical protein